MELKKSYKGFLIWLLIYLGLLFLIAFLPVEDTAFSVRILLNMSNIMFLALLWMIRKTGYIYWFTEFSYDDARRIEEDKRKAYAQDMMNIFLRFFVFYLVFSAMMAVFSLSYWYDIVIFCITMILTVFLTNRVKIEK